MYRHGFGDCFLLCFTPADSDGDQPTSTSGDEPESDARRPRWVLIDCGVIGQPRQSINGVVEDIGATTRRLDLVVATHAHWDHVSGFAVAQSEFAGIEIGQVWLPSTEDRGNPAARALVERRQRQLQILRRLARSQRVGSAPLARNIDRLLELFGECASASGEGEERRQRPGLTDALAFLQDEHVRTVRYLDSREPARQLLGMEGVRVYVLGPPRHEAIRGGAVSADGGTAEERATLDLATSFLAAAHHQAPGGMTDDRDPGLDGADYDDLTPEDRLLYKEELEQSMPFESRYRLQIPGRQAADVAAATRSASGGTAAAPSPAHGAAGRQRPRPPSPETRSWFDDTYHQPSHDWRRIDDDWLGVARALVLALERQVSDSSLVLAFELTATGKVLLFPGDAQLGSSAAWSELTWTLPSGMPPGATHGDGSNGTTVSALDLIRRTKVYKVAHHCSATATPLTNGLDIIDRGDLVALLSVDAATADAYGWDMPNRPLLARLEERTRGRVIRSDEPVPAEPGHGTEAARDPTWKAFRANVKDADLYAEYTIIG